MTTEAPDMYDTITDEWAEWTLEELVNALQDDQAQCAKSLRLSSEALPPRATLEAIESFRDTADILTRRTTPAEITRGMPLARQNRLVATARELSTGTGARLLGQLVMGAMLKRIKALEVELELARLGDSAPPVEF